MAVRTWNADGKATTATVLDALVVETSGVDPELMEEDAAPAVDPEPVLNGMAAIRMWSGFDSFVLDDAGLLETMGLDYPGADIPSWMMTELGPLAAKEKITLDEFILALEYVLEGA